MREKICKNGKGRNHFEVKRENARVPQKSLNVVTLHSCLKKGQKKEIYIKLSKMPKATSAVLQSDSFVHLSKTGVCNFLVAITVVFALKQERLC